MLRRLFAYPDTLLHERGGLHWLGLDSRCRLGYRSEYRCGRRDRCRCGNGFLNRLGNRIVLDFHRGYRFLLRFFRLDVFSGFLRHVKEFIYFLI